MNKYFIGLIFLFSSLTLLYPQSQSQKLDNALQFLRNGEAESSFVILKRSATTNNIYAQFYLAQCYEYGIGIDVNLKEAFLLYRKCAERGLPQAMLELSKCYLNGKGVGKNVDKANAWLSRYHSKTNIKTIPNILAIYNSSTHENKPLLNDNSTPRNEVAINETSHLTIQEASGDIPLDKPLANPRQTVPDHAISYSDVDMDVPLNNINNESTFALVIANENYQEVAKVSNALNDGEIFSQYCNKVMGIPKTNIHLIKDATLNNIKREINLIQQIANAYKGEASFIIYYAGHGIPEEKTHESYILPIDGYPSDITTCISLDYLYSLLGDLPSEKNVVFIDACFSGSIRGNGMLASARGIAIKAEKGIPKGNTIVISSAQGDETAHPYEEKKHGLFTYYLLKKLKDTTGNISLGELVEYVIDNVSKKSLVINGKAQTPSASASENVINIWSNWTLLK